MTDSLQKCLLSFALESAVLWVKDLAETNCAPRTQKSSLKPSMVLYLPFHVCELGLTGPISGIS